MEFIQFNGGSSTLPLGTVGINIIKERTLYEFNTKGTNAVGKLAHLE